MWLLASCTPIVGLSSGSFIQGGAFFECVLLLLSNPGHRTHKWVSISAQTNRARFVPFASNFKGWKDAYFRVRHGENGRQLMYDADDNPLFPFYWTSDPRLVKAIDLDALSPSEWYFVQFLESFNLIPFRDIQKVEDDDVTLKSILRKMSQVTNSHWKAHLATARRLRSGNNQPNTFVDLPVVGALVASNSIIGDPSSVKRGRDDSEPNVEGSSQVEVVNAGAKSPKAKRTKKEKTIPQIGGQTGKHPPSGVDRRFSIPANAAHIPANAAHIPLSPSVDVAEFIDQHYCFHREDEKLRNMGLEEASRCEELNDASKKLKEAEDSARIFEEDLRKVQTFLKEDKARRDQLKTDLNGEIANLKEKLKAESDCAAED
ncbi:unnamed protein product [Trifolium pratense]|uniref:Uncharacterized protein n=1 Tax=Trifolium pratense TaxID=57577 RepID=A0ACB0LQT1_TRIPR|nr:unnamed protein product [Trifolium pratense]